MLIKRYYKSLLCFVLIAVLCFLPSDTANNVRFFNIPHFDKMVHFGMYFIFSLALYADLKKNSQLQKKQIFSIILILSIIIGGSIEIIQHYIIPGRSGDCFDLLADSAGSFGFILIYLLKK